MKVARELSYGQFGSTKTTPNIFLSKAFRNIAQIFLPANTDITANKWQLKRILQTSKFLTWFQDAWSCYRVHDALEPQPSPAGVCSWRRLSFQWFSFSASITGSRFMSLAGVGRAQLERFEHASKHAFPNSTPVKKVNTIIAAEKVR